MRTLVIHIGGIGDFLLCCSALRLLAQDGPVDLLGRRDRLQLAVAGGIAEAAYALGEVEFDTVFTHPSPRLTTFLRAYDRCLAFMKDDGEIKAAIESCGMSHVETCPGLPPNNWNRHAWQYYFDAVGRFRHKPQLSGAPLVLNIPPSATRRDVLIHPGSGGKHKNWPRDNFLAVTFALAGFGRSVTWIRGPAEETFSFPAGIDVLRKDSLVELAAELAATRQYIGNDSGITHLAAAVGCPTIAIFGPTNPAVWAPRGAHVKILQADPWPTVDSVLAEL